MTLFIELLERLSYKKDPSFHSFKRCFLIDDPESSAFGGFQFYRASLFF
jgi:hypothetical protein